MIDGRIASALDECIAAVRGGAGIDECLRRHPRLRPELDSLLLFALQLDEDEPAAFAPAVKASLRSNLMEAIVRDERRPVAVTTAAPARHRRARPSPARRHASARPEPDSRRVAGVIGRRDAASASGAVGATRPRLRLPSLNWRLGFVPAAVLALVLVAVALGAFGQSRSAFAPSESTAAERQTVLTVLDGEVEAETAQGLVKVGDGYILQPGDKVITGPGARAVLTFFEGSTVTLDSDTVVTLRSVESDAGKLQVVLSQDQGSTWTHVPTALGPADVEIETPSARVAVKEASASTTVSHGQTEVGAESGSVAVQASDGSAATQVPGGFRTSVETSGAVIAPVLTEKPVRELVLRVQGTTQAFVTEPGGATLGTVSPGVPVNQVTGTRAEKEGDTLVLRLPNPSDGRYHIGLTATVDGVVYVGAQLQDGGQSLDTKVDARANQGWNVDFSLAGDVLTLLNVAQRLDVKAVPSEVVVPPAAASKVTANATPVATARPADPTETPPPATETPPPTATPSATPTQTPVPPTATPTPRPIRTPIKEPIDPSPIEPATIDASNDSRTLSPSRLTP